MACMGPSKEYAFTVGENAFEDIKEILKETYCVYEPAHPLARVGPNDDERIAFLKRAGYIKTRNERERWDEDMKKLKQLLQEIVWEHHANNF